MEGAGMIMSGIGGRLARYPAEKLTYSSKKQTVSIELYLKAIFDLEIPTGDGNSEKISIRMKDQFVQDFKVIIGQPASTQKT
jgi:hypothetical protein